MSDSFYSRSFLAVAGSLLLGVACGQAPAFQSAADAGGSGGDGVVARVGDRAITLSEVDEKAIQSNMKAYQELYNVRRQALDELLAEALLAREATERGVTSEELVAQEITAKVQPVSEDDVETFFEQNSARLGGRTLEQIGPQIRQFLEAQRANAARQSFLSELRSDADVAVNLEPPRVPVQVASGEPAKGPPDAPVTIVEYSDFQ